MIDFDDKDIYKILKDKTVEEQLGLLKRSWDSHGTIYEYGDDFFEFVTGGWSDNEELINIFTDIRNNEFSHHYIGYIRGGSHYFYFGDDTDYIFKIVKEKKN